MMWNELIVIIGSSLLGIGSAAIGCFALLRRRALAGDAVAHAALPGVAVAFLLAGKNPAALLGGAAATGWLSMASVDAIVRRSSIREDGAIGIVLSVFFGLGILLITHIQAGGSAAQSGLNTFLFGQAAALLPEDLWVFGGVSLVLVLGILLLYKEFALLSFDRDYAATSGLPVRRLELAMTTMIVLAVVSGLQAVGVVLMAAMLIAPAAAARYWTDRLPVMIGLAIFFGIVSGVAGALISASGRAMPTGPWIITAATACVLLSMLFAPRRGVLARALRRKRYQRRAEEENVLKAMHHLGERDGRPMESRSIDEIRAVRPFSSDQLGSALRRLLGDRFVERLADGRWRFTAEGARQGERVTRLHRLWEVYLTEHLQLALDHVHDDAESIEHILTPELEQELQQLLDHPAVDPHSRSIPYTGSAPNTTEIRSGEEPE